MPYHSRIPIVSTMFASWSSLVQADLLVLPCGGLGGRVQLCQEKCMKTKAQISAALILLVCAAATAYGQTAGAGTITGTVRDPSSAIVPGASVVVRNTDTGIE